MKRKENDESHGHSVRRRPSVLLALGLIALILGVVVAGCGGSSSSSSAEAEPAAESEAAETGSEAEGGEEEAEAAGGETEEASSEEGGEANIEGKSVFVVSCAPSDPYCATFNEDLQKGLEAGGASVNLVTNPKNSALEEQELVQAISQQPDLIVNLPTDSLAVAQGYAKAKAAGIPVISAVNPVSEQAAESVTSQIYDNNQDMGRAAAENIQAGLKEIGAKKANVISITGNAESATTVEREEAFEKQLESTPQFKIVAVEDGKFDPIKTQEIASQLFASNQAGGIQAAYGMTGLQAVGIARAAKQAGLPVGVANKGIIISGSNCGPDSIKAIESGELYGDASETPSGDAEAVLPWAVKVLEGQEIPKVVKIPQEAITKANVAEHAEACNY